MSNAINSTIALCQIRLYGHEPQDLKLQLHDKEKHKAKQSH